MSFLAGAFSVVLAWVAYEVFRNPHGHRGGREEFKPVLARPYREPDEPGPLETAVREILDSVPPIRLPSSDPFHGGGRRPA